GSIGEYGVDVLAAMSAGAGNDSIMDPAIFCDVMSYCTRWIGPYTYEGLFDAIQGSYGMSLQSLSVSASVWSLPQSEFLHAVVRIHHRGARAPRLEVRRAFSVWRAPPRSPSMAAGYFAEALGRNGTHVGTYVGQQAALPSDCGCKAGA